MKFYTDGLEKKQIEVLKKSGVFLKKNGFYLAGGTALSIYFGHRVSVDFDWFTSNKIDDALILAQSLRDFGLNFKTEQTAPGTLHGTIDGVRVTLLEFNYPLLDSLTLWQDMDCNLASLDDITCMKLSAVAQRGARKDFCDVYVLGTKHRPLSEMLNIYKQKFSVDVSPVLYGLTYFDDAESERMPTMLWDVKWTDIKKTIQNWVKELQIKQ
ncbi:MAG: nucleotidyl transferase AbiEii/AbiGii toxin family protein [Chloroflexi bacterium]|nr:nucleotidyl transferase AbiEii/AbiGii toxin family protein [Chloroflexota bacterium]